MNFYEWLKLQTKRNDPVGDLARDAMEDQFAGVSVSEWARRLEKMHASDGAMKALREASKEWKKTQ